MQSKLQGIHDKSLCVLWLPLFLLLFCSCQAGGNTATASALERSPTKLPTLLEATETPASTSAPAMILVPSGSAAVIDGRISPGEWERAAVQFFGDGSELFLMQDGHHLYVGIRSSTPEMIVGNLFLELGDEIKILHVSAALGTAVYHKEDQHWQQTQDFIWRCRQTNNSEAAAVERETFFRDERWISINARMGTPNELEYQIEIPDERFRMAANLLRSSQGDVKVPWPADLEDDCVLPTPGGLPSELNFEPDRWAVLELSGLD